MKPPRPLFVRGFAFCAECAGSFVLWSVWLLLTLLLALQIYVHSANELALPAFMQRRLEARLAESGLQATFGRATFDPSGRILIENAQVSLPGIGEPILRARSVYVRLNPWYLSVGLAEPRLIRIAGATAAVPALLSPTGRSQELVRELAATLVPEGHALRIEQLDARVAGIVLSARGTLPLARPVAGPAREPWAAAFARQFPAFCRQALAAAAYAGNFEAPMLEAVFAPSASGATTVRITLLARAATFADPLALRATQVRASTRLLLFGETPTTWIEFSAADLQVADRVRFRDLHASLGGRFRSDSLRFDARELALSAAEIAAEGLAARSVSLVAHPRDLPRLEASAVARIFGAPLALAGEAELENRSGRVRLRGEIDPAILDAIAARLRVDVRRFFSFTALELERGEAAFGPGWQFEQLTARVRVEGIDAYGVKMTDGRAVVELDPRRFRSPDAFARVGDNFARGSYEQDLRTLEHRFLLAGRLRPLELSPWFREWWSNFFSDFVFPEAPPRASVDVRGVWRSGLQSSVFIFADAAKPVIRGGAFDQVRTRIFVRPGFVDGLEFVGTREAGVAEGRFTFVDPPGRGWESVDVAATSTLELGLVRQVIGPLAETFLAPIRVSAPPEVAFRGRFQGPGHRDGRNAQVEVVARTKGEFRYQDFPVHDAAFSLKVADGNVLIENFEARFGDGIATGRAQVSGSGAQRRLGFDFALKDAALGRTAGTLADFFARLKNLPPAPPGKFVQEKAAVQLNLAASGEGDYDNPFSYRGSGNASLSGSEIGEVPLLGLLSELLRFTSLRFTEANANFKIEGNRLVFPEVKLRGANSAIDARGSYALDRRELDFNAKLYPFQESNNLLKTVVGAVLSPLSSAFEVKLSGTLDKPAWAFVIGPTNLLRSLAGGDGSDKSAPAPAPAAPASAPPAAAPGGPEVSVRIAPPAPTPAPAAPAPAEPIPE